MKKITFIVALVLTLSACGPVSEPAPTKPMIINIYVEGRHVEPTVTPISQNNRINK